MAFEFETERHHHRHAATSPNSVSFMAACRICRPLQLYLLISGLSVLFSLVHHTQMTLFIVCHMFPTAHCVCVCVCFAVVSVHNAHGLECALFVGLWMTEMGFEC